MAKRLLLTPLAVLLLGVSAYAHEGASHAKRTFDASRLEETAFGQEGDPAEATRTIKVSMSDNMRFRPARVEVRAGETVRFVPANKGAVLHEMVLGTPRELAKHAELMKKFPGMEHDEPNMAHVKPGASGELVWKFTKPGSFQFACLIPGHFEAGMVGQITVK